MRSRGTIRRRPRRACGIALAVLAGLASVAPLAWAQLTVEQGDFKFTLSGRVVIETGYITNPTAPTAANGFTLYAAPEPLRARPTASVSGRQTGISFVVEPPSLGSFAVKGIIDVSLMGSDPGAGSPGAFVGAAFVEFQNDSWRFAFGRFGALVAPLSASAVNWAGIEAGGDLNALGPRDQVRIERHIASGSHWMIKLQGAITNPEQNFLVPQDDRITENAGIPNVEGRMFLGYGEKNKDGNRRVEVGVSGMAGRLRGEENVIRIEDDSWAAALDYALRWPRFGVSGEVWNGRGLGSYGGGISQSASEASDRLLRSHGFWVQGWVRPAKRFRVSAIYGLDDPEDDQLAANQRRRNAVFVGNVFFEAHPALTFAYEARRYRTDYISPARDGDAWVHQILARYDW